MPTLHVFEFYVTCLLLGFLYGTWYEIIFNIFFKTLEQNLCICVPGALVCVRLARTHFIDMETDLLLLWFKIPWYYFLSVWWPSFSMNFISECIFNIHVHGCWLWNKSIFMYVQCVLLFQLKLQKIAFLWKLCMSCFSFAFKSIGCNFRS